MPVAEVRRGKLPFVLVALVLAGLFVRLGFWQLHRLAERRELNSVRRARLALPVRELTPEDVSGRLAARAPVDAVSGRPTAATPEDAVPGPPSSGTADDSLLWRRVQVRGRYDFAHEVLLAGRSYEGAPGVDLLTPLVLRENLAVMVLRGWLAAPDGIHAPIRSARPEPAAGPVGARWVRGIAVPGAPAPRLLAAVSRSGRRPPPPAREIDGELHPILTRLDLETVSDLVPYSLMPFYILAAAEDGSPGPLRPRPVPELTRGPHLSYAIQWFSFALVALVGTAAFLRKGSRLSFR